MAVRTAKIVPAPRSASNRTHVRVAFDRHLVGIVGDEHYPASEYLFRELAANAYDADATEVRFEYNFSGDEGGYKLIVEDNGNGMSREELSSYFTFGAKQKVKQGKSPVFKRPLIGRFGLGKVSALKAAKQWFLTTEHDAKRYFVDVDFGRWMDDPDMSGFVVETRQAKHQNGTRIELVGVHTSTRFREDRIVRAIRELPLSSKFKVYLNGRRVVPREWEGTAYRHYDIELDVPIEDAGRVEKITGRVWVRKTPMPIDEGKVSIATESVPLKEIIDEQREALAGVEVKVHGATICREFFERKTHAHGVNYLWGYVNADWLPVLANRTDFVRDSPEGHAFFRAMYDRFGEIYRDWRADETGRAKLKAKADIAKTTKRTAEATEISGELPKTTVTKTKRYLDEVGIRVQKLFETEPSFVPFFGAAPRTRVGRPTNRIRPLFSFNVVPSLESDAEAAEREFNADDHEITTTATLPKVRKGRGRPVARAGTTFADKTAEPQAVVQPINNIALQLNVSEDGPQDAPYRWGKDPRGEPILYVNVDYPLHRIALKRTESHRLYLGLVIALALSERRWNAVARQRISDYVLDLVQQSVAPGLD